MNKYGKIFVCMVLITLLISTGPLLARGEEGPMNEVYSFKMNQKLDPILASYYGNIDPGTSMLFFSPTTEIIPIILKVAMNTTTKEFEIIPGFETRSIIGNIITANIPITSLNVLTELACVEYIYSSQPGNFNLELSVEEIRATSVWDMRKGGSSLSGNGVIIGIIDSGIDYTHQDFWYDEGGVKKTRILSIWDQTQNGGSPPSGYFFGSEYTSDDINYALTQINPHVYVPEKDIYGHGTHVAGIAAGDGSAWTEDSTRSGVAPGANIMFVKVPYSFTEADAIDGMNYLVSQAKGINKPIVVSMSISSGVLTAHDGTSPWEITIDNLAEEGVIFVTAAGNEANKDRHASGTASITTTSFEIDCEPFSSVISNQIWFEQGNDMLLYLDMPPDPRNSIIKTCGPFRCNDNESYIFWHEYPYWDVVNEDWVVAKNKITVYYTENNPINRDNAILINIEGNMYYPRPSTNEPQPLPLPEPDSPWAPVQKGIWSFRLYHNSGSNPAYESWIQSNPHTIRTCAYTKDCSSQETTIISPATANSAIAVGSYKTRPETIILPGGVTVDIPGVGTKSYFSSIGPTRDNRNKPDLLAPGTIFSAKSNDGTGEWHSNVGEPLLSLALDNIGEDVQGTDDYKRMDGTSMAAPHVSGVVALMLQVNPTFTKEEIMNILIDFTAKNFNPESIWNNEYGWGKLNDCESMLRRPIININNKATTTIMNNCNIDLYAPDPGYGGWDSMRLSNSQSMNWVDIGDPNIESPHGNSQSQQQTYVLDPFGSSNYPNNYLGEWHINGNHWTKIHFKYLNILDGDWLTIQGTGGGTIGISGVNFGSVWTPQPIYGDVTIRFTSDSSGTLPGFEIDMIETYIGYPRNSFNMWEINEPGATQMKVHFENINLATGDYVYLYDVNNALISTYSGTSGAIWSPVIPGDTIRIRFVSNNDYYTAWGFKIDQYQYYDAPWSAWQPYSTTANWQLSSGDGLKTVYCQVMDYAGNLAQTSDTITLETTPPVISTQSISESSPYLHVLDSSLYYSDMMESSAQMFTIQGTATSDGGSPLWKATATSAFGDSPSVDFSPADWSFSYNVFSADSGNGAITITAYDTVGNTNSITYPYVEDNTGPSMRNVFPPHNMVLADTTPYFTWSGSDPLGLSSNGFRIQISNNADFSSTIYNEVVANNVIECPIILSDSVYYWKVIGTDNVGNSGQSPTYSFVVDTISPTAQITSPSSGTTVNGIINIQGTATDSNILSYKLEKGWGATPSDFELLTSSTSGKTGILYTLDTTEMINYVYTLKLTVEDKACHITSQSITITVSNPNEIKNLALNSVTPEYLSCRFFLNSPQVVTAWIEDSSGGIIKNIHQNVVMGSGLYPSGLIWDWTDAAGIIIGAGDYVIKVDSYTSPLVSLDIHIRDAPIISVSSGYGSTQPTFSWNNLIGYTPTWHICRQNYLDITTTSTSKSISCPEPSQTIEIYGIYENYITRVGSITYTPNLARIYGSISAPDSFWSMRHRVCISVTYDANPNEIGWSPVGVTSVQSDIGSYELFVPAGDYRIMAVLYTTDFIFGYDLPYGVFMHVDEYNEYEIDFSIIEKPPYSGGSGCPYAYAWNGEEYQIDNNIIGKSEYVDNAAPDVTDYFKFDIEPEILDGAYSIAIGETGNEYSIFDSFELLLVDHNSDTNIIMDTDGIVRTYGSLQPPISCVDKHGYNQLQNISTAEEFMYNGYADDWLVLNFGLVDSNSVKLVLNTDEKPKPPINPLLETNEAPGPIDILVMDEWGQWQNVTSIYPRDLWYYDMVDISSYVSFGSQLKVKLIWESYHKLDFIGLDISEDEAIEIHHVPLMRATDGSLNNMTEYLKYSDGRYIEMAPNQFITLEYQYVEQTKNERDFILISKGYYASNDEKPTANVLSLPTASFTYEPIYFDARGSEASNGNITGYFYYFGDGTTSGWLSNPITYHQFTDDGVYNITMIVKDDNIPYRIEITTTTVTVFNSKPEPVIEIFQDVNISLRMTGRKGNSATVQIYEDDVLIIEESVTRTPDNPNAEMAWVSLHIYLNRDYRVVLLYDATHLGANPTWLNFTSGETYVPFFMDFSTKNGCHQIVLVPTSYLDSVTETNPSYWFDASGSYDLDGGIVSYLWDFGDNTTSEDIMVEHTYSAPGLYTVTLTVSDNDGAIAKETLVVEVYPT